jgi:hypothetical protein
MKILLANLGNRNIKYKGAYYQDHKKNNTEIVSFRAWTQRLLQNYESEKNHISIQIIDRVIDSEHGRELNKVILIASDQSDETVNGQDTLYEAEIIKKILAERYPKMEFIIDTIQENVSNTDDIMVVMRRKITSYEYYDAQPQYVYCTSGGTGQMKNAVKLLLQYMIPSDRLKLIYVAPHEEVREETVDQYKIILDNIQKENLVKNGLFQAALNIDQTFDFGLNQFNRGKVSELSKITLLAHWIQKRNHTQIKELHNSLKKKSKEKFSLGSDFESFKEAISISELNEEPKYALEAGLLYQNTLFNNSLQNYTELTVSVAVFYEYYINALISINTPYDLLSPKEGGYREEIGKLKKEYSRLKGDSIYSKCRLLLSLDLSDNVSRFVHYLSKRLNDGNEQKVENALNTARSKIVHNGKIITIKNNRAFVEALQNDISEFQKIFDKPRMLEDLQNALCKMYRA